VSDRRGGISFDLSGVPLRIRGLSRPFEGRLAGEWSFFRAEPLAEPFLDLDVTSEEAPAPAGRFDPKAMRSDLSHDRAFFGMPEGSAAVDSNGRATVRLSTAVEGERTWFAFMNLLRAALAWRLPSRGGALLHAAGIVLEGRAFVLAGAQDSGKSTFAALAESSGARVLSDDLVLLDSEGPTVDALGAPFRSTHPGTSSPGRWPVAALLFPVHGTSARLTALPRIVARARIAANLPFVADALGTDPRIAALIDRLVEAVPVRELTFARDPSFVEPLRTFAG